MLFFFFFFQAEDGIRDYKVTGVQTCALPILASVAPGLPLSLGIRPEYLALASADAPGAVACTVERVQDVGTHQLLVARLGERLLKLRCGADAFLPAAGQTVWVQLQGPHTCYYVNEELQA